MFKKGALLLIPYPFSDLSAQKKRPVLALTEPDQLGDFCALPVTSQSYHKNSISLTAYLKTGELPKPSWVRTDHIVTLNQSLIIKELATCTQALMDITITDLCRYIQDNETI